MKRYKFIKQFEDLNKYTQGEEVLEVGYEYDGDYTPKGWHWNIEDHVSKFAHHWEIIEESKVKDNKALRYNSDKPMYSLLDLNAFEPCVKVLEFGAVKYDRDNWQKGFPFSTILDSMMRHIAALQRGEWLDPESGLPHIGHIQCNAMFLGGKNNTMDIEALKQPEKCCGDWDNFGQCKCKENA